MRLGPYLVGVTLTLSIVGFTDHSNEETEPIPSAAFGDLRGHTSIYSIGLEWDLVGDENHDARATVNYRLVGKTDWEEALDLLRVDYAEANMLAGSIMFLEPGNSYEVRVDGADPDGGSDRRTLSLTTRALPRRPSEGRAVHVVPGPGGGDGSEADPFRGLEAAWSAASPGDTLLLHEGHYAGVRDGSLASGSPESPIVIRAFGDGEVRFDYIELFQQSHVWFEGLTFRFTGSETGFYSCLPNDGYDNGFRPMKHNVEGIVLVRNVFVGYTHSIRLGPRTSGWYIADNVIVGDKQLGQTGTLSFDGEGIELAHGNDHTVAHNSISLVADGISFPNRNCDIFGNDVFDVTDDGIELDGGLANTRAWGNRIHNAGHNGIGFQPMGGAPWYLVRNQIVNFQESAFKFRETDRFVALHNTVVNRGNVFDHWAGQMLRGVTRNNLWISFAGGQIWARGHDSIDWRTDLDYDGFHWGASSIPFVYEGVSHFSLKSLVKATGMQSNGKRIRRSCFDALEVPGPAPMKSVPPQRVTLKDSCAAVDAGVILPNINDDFYGAAPDMGAHEKGRPLPHYGPRE